MGFETILYPKKRITHLQENVRDVCLFAFFGIDSLFCLENVSFDGTEDVNTENG